MKLSNILRYQLNRKRYIIQLSPVRTGSTLIYNLLRESLPHKKLVKQHTYSSLFGHLPIVVTVRHPFDAVASICRVNEFGVSDETLPQAFKSFSDNGAADVVRIKDKPNVLVLYYHKFINDYEYVFSEFERFFSIRISPELRASLTEKYSLKSARKIAESKGSFGQWDPVTMIHGEHISDNADRHGYASELFSESQLAYLSEYCADFMTAFGYDDQVED